jgi:hypothetical protein
MASHWAVLNQQLAAVRGHDGPQVSAELDAMNRVLVAFHIGRVDRIVQCD